MRRAWRIFRGKASPPENPQWHVTRQEFFDYETRWTRVSIHQMLLVCLVGLIMVGGLFYNQVRIDQNREKSFTAICRGIQAQSSDLAGFALAVNLLFPDHPTKAVPKPLPVQFQTVDRQAKSVYRSQRLFSKAKCTSRADLERITREVMDR